MTFAFLTAQIKVQGIQKTVFVFFFIRLDMCASFYKTSHGPGVRGGVLSGLAPPTGFSFVGRISRMSGFAAQSEQRSRQLVLPDIGRSVASRPIRSRAEIQETNVKNEINSRTNVVLLLISPHYYVQCKTKHLQSTISTVLSLGSVGYRTIMRFDGLAIK